jgi:hypothetical protein
MLCVPVLVHNPQPQQLLPTYQRPPNIVRSNHSKIEMVLRETLLPSDFRVAVVAK